MLRMEKLKIFFCFFICKLEKWHKQFGDFGFYCNCITCKKIEDEEEEIVWNMEKFEGWKNWRFLKCSKFQSVPKYFEVLKISQNLIYIWKSSQNVTNNFFIKFHTFLLRFSFQSVPKNLLRIFEDLLLNLRIKFLRKKITY